MKSKTMNENKDIKTVLPKLRFSEFVGNWSNTRLGEIARVVTNKVSSDKAKNYLSTENILQDFGGVNFGSVSAPINITSYNIGDVLLSNIRPYLKKVYFSTVNGGCSNDVLVFKANVNCNHKYMYYVIASDRFIDFAMLGAKGVKMPRGDKDQMLSYRLSLPNKEEQTKIAECLSSLDNVISGASDKILALKEYKKGLMQQLFPAEGKTTPAYRFPEFQNDGEWLETTLDAELNYENGKAHENDISSNGHYIVVNSKFISTDGNVRKFTDTPYCLANENDILIVLSDVPNGRAIAKCFIVDESDRYTVNQRVCKLSTKGVNSQFLYYILNRNAYFLSFDDGVKQTNLKKDDVLKCPLIIPNDPKEQQKIATTLSSIDNLIEAENSHLDQLKVHKKGLMQQLFPNLNE